LKEIQAKKEAEMVQKIIEKVGIKDLKESKRWTEKIRLPGLKEKCL
jgi:hypothetical protein